MKTEARFCLGLPWIGMSPVSPTSFLAAGLLLAAAVNGFGQPVITAEPTKQSVSLGERGEILSEKDAARNAPFGTCEQRVERKIKI